MRHLIAIGLLLVACGESAPSPTEAAEPPPTPPTLENGEGGESETNGQPETEHATTPMNEVSARALLDAWLSAQNEGNFERYSALFADPFQGVKRADDRVYRFGRAAWLENRARMFQRPMSVTLSDVTVRATATTATIRFTQRWSSATFEDVGPKEIVLVVQDGELRIAREEMLESERERPQLESGLFMLAIRHTNLYAVLAAQTDEVGSGAPALLPRESEPVAAWRASADEDGILGREVRVFTAAGTHCDGTLGPPRLMRRVVPHFGSVQAWNGEEGAPYPDAQIAEDIWTMSAEKTLRVAEVQGCSEGLWVAAREASPQFYTPSAGGGDAAGRAFQGLPDWRDLQETWSDEFDGDGPWDAAPGPAPTAFQTWTHQGLRIVTVEGRGGAGCVEFYGRLSGIFDLEGDRAVSRTNGDSSMELDFLSVVDIDTDGTPEIVVKDGLLRRNASGAYERVIDITPPFLDCDC